MTLRDHISSQKRYAHSILDQVRAGARMEDRMVIWALAILGDLL